MVFVVLALSLELLGEEFSLMLDLLPSIKDLYEFLFVDSHEGVQQARRLPVALEYAHKFVLLLL